MVEQEAQVLDGRVRVAAESLDVRRLAPAALIPGDDAVVLGEDRDLVHPDGMAATGAVAQYHGVAAAGALVVDLLVAGDGETGVGLKLGRSRWIAASPRGCRGLCCAWRVLKRRDGLVD